jgi:integrase
MAKRINAVKYPGVFYRELSSKLNGRPDRVYEFCYQDGGRKRWQVAGRASEGMTAQLANAARMEKITEAKAAGQGPAGSMRLSLKEAAEHRALNSRLTNKAASTLRQFPRFFGDALIKDIDRALIERAKAATEERYQFSTRKYFFFEAKKTVQIAIKDGLYPGENPFVAHEAKLRGQETKCSRFLDKEEAKALLAELAKSAPAWRDLAYLSLHTGARLSELYKLRGSDVRGSVAYLQGKSGKKEHVFLTEGCLEITRARDLEAKGGLLFPGAAKSAPKFTAAVKRLGLNDRSSGNEDKVWFHTLRHTFASWLAQQGVGIYAIQKLMRHASVSMTERYAHLSEASIRENAELVKSWGL